ncbi:DUF5018 domain-containing protein (plasmid) [Paraburkholderia sp. PREW-6R]|uniref:DUF5018 domain-containing protein n=1 Tax=Paraburkholderia sp. PREW-6R TaxID=3141544 RepID=UPI0031F4CE9F
MLKKGASKSKHFAGLLGLLCVCIGMTGCGGSLSDPPSTGSSSSAAQPSSLSASKDMASFSLNGVAGVIVGNTISVTLPYGSSLTSLVATFATTGREVSVGQTTQVSGVTTNDFSHPITYTVTAPDGSKANYIVSVSVAGASAKSITSFSLNGVAGVISGQTISVTLPSGSLLTGLRPVFTDSGVTVAVNGTPQVSGVTTQDFTGPLQYVVSAADGTSVTYTVTVSAASTSAKALTGFSLNGVAGVINGQNIAVTLPAGTDLTSLLPVFSTTGVKVSVAGVTQGNGVAAQDFSGPVNYVVTAADGSTSTYTVTAAVAPANAKAITSFSLDGIAGVISGQNISVTVPFGTLLTDLQPTFTTTAASVSLGGANLVSGASAADFSNPQTLVVTAADGSSTTYSLSVNIAAGNAKAITAFSINGVPGLINGQDISITLPFGTALNNLQPLFTTTGQSVAVGSRLQVSGSSLLDFGAPLDYVVTAADGSTAIYHVTVSVAPSTAKSITAFSLDGVPGQINGQSITVTLPPGSLLTAQQAKFTTTGGAVTVNGVTQVSGASVLDFSHPETFVVTAADGSTADYNVNVVLGTGLKGL